MTNDDLREQVAAIVDPNAFTRKANGGYLCKNSSRRKEARDRVDTIISLVQADAFEQAAEAIKWPPDSVAHTDFAHGMMTASNLHVTTIRALATSKRHETVIDINNEIER